METEIWKDIPGYEGYYQVSNLGKVKSLNRIISHAKFGKQKRHERILSLVKDERGRLNVRLCKNYTRIMAHVHVLVLTAFVGPRPENMEACHFPDRDTKNNRLDNLRWDTKLNNKKDELFHGTRARGEINGSAKLKNDEVLEIKKMIKKNKLTCLEISKLFNISRSIIYGIRANRIWRFINVE